MSFSDLNISEVQWQEAFSRNFYLTEEWARLWQSVTGAPLRTETWEGNTYSLLRNVLPGISAFDSAFRNSLRARGIVHMNVLPERNGGGAYSPLDYALWLHRSYADASAAYDSGFRRAVAHSVKNNIIAVFRKRDDPSLIDDVYPLYLRHMARVNGIVLPRKYLENYLNLEGAFCLTLSHRDKVIGYGFGIEYGNNLYASLGGSDASIFPLRPSHRLYDALIHHAAEHHLNIHFGWGFMARDMPDLKPIPDACC